jgi:hypothetical protein
MFEESMKAFNGQPETGVQDWAKMEFVGGNINEFIDTVETYKSIFSVGLSIITLLVAIPRLL